MQAKAIIICWLHTILLLCLAIVVLGGATRLTGSGLSITQWQPIHGIIPPLSIAQWQQEFLKYQQIAQYQLLHQNMSLQEFKSLFWWEWSHRLLARIIGFIALMPLLAYGLWGSHMRTIYRSYLGYFILVPVLVGLQGVIGWWMVYSGLAGSPLTSVSQYRLALHMLTACSLITIISYLAGKLINYSEEAPSNIAQIFAGLLAFFILLQIYLGALVAGLHAGLSFNSWPLMAGKLVPDTMLILQPWWRNFFENIVTVQFVHRGCAYIILLLALSNFLYVKHYAVNTTHYRRSIILLLMVVLQIALGITTLLLYVPILWALMHQAFALVLLVFAVMHYCATTAKAT